MNIRRAEKKDIPQILSILIQVNNIHSALRPDLFIKDRTKYSQSELEKILHSDSSPIFVAEDEKGNAVGYGFCVLEDHSADNNRTPIKTLYIDDICVDANFRGKHIGKAIYEYIEKFARESLCHNITLNVWENNTPARKFYENCGMGVKKTCMEKIL